jgi:hypothetical protein
LGSPTLLALVGTVPRGCTACGDRSTINDLLGVKMKVVGTPRVLIAESEWGPYRESPGVLEHIISNVWDIATRLEPLIPE